MTENETAKEIVDSALWIHKSLGPGLLEKVYQKLLVAELTERGINIEEEVSIPFEYRGLKFDEGLRVDLVVEDKVIVELKSVESIAPVHLKQLKTYLVLSNKKLGLLINFGANYIKDGIKRVVNGLPD